MTAGKTGPKSNSGMDETGATHILLDPTSPVDARVLYVAGYGRGVYKSSNGGTHLDSKNSGITQKQPFAWRLARSSNGTLYVVIARQSEDGSLGNAGDGALYRSADGAEHWERVSLPEGTNGPNGLAVDPDSPIVFISQPGPGRLENTETEEEFFFRRMAARVGSKCSTRTAIFTTSPLIRKMRMCSTRRDSNRRPGDPRTAGWTGVEFPASTSSGATE